MVVLLIANIGVVILGAGSWLNWLAIGVLSVGLVPPQKGK